ncbi:Coenzyme F420 hydrogenase/dehydrogenase, beta subunit C-terminal domain [Photobacterium piscicola]|uniref:Coenzyme F420 hydrogenase/dehydrogenase, beta subunit C-terminal domain n=1 Tax=Photobacterium piscicola TaxID=1378299 RepID=UPI003734E04C
MNIKDIIDNDWCSGCGLCASVNSNIVSMKLNEKGYLRPKLVSNENINLDYCPGNTLKLNKSNIKYYTNWGYIKNISVGFSNDEEVRYKGSSGGVISQIAISLLEKNSVDGIIHIGVDINNPLKNITKISRNREDVLSNAGSRYAPASPLSDILQIIDKYKNEAFAFIGKPCDVAAIKQYIQIHPELNKNIKYFISFMCAGTPSIEGSYEVLNKLNIKKDDLILFNYRGDGWPGKTLAVDKYNNSNSMEYNDSWGKVLGSYIQKRCKICPDGIGEFADIVCADAWHGDKNGYPDFTEQDGRSLIISRTDNGDDLYKMLVNENIICTEKFDIEMLGEIQPAQRHRRQTLLVRLFAFHLLLKKTPKYEGLYLYKSLKTLTIKRQVIAFLGTITRIIKRKL